MLRSFFHKSSTVAKAIEEAWLSAGKPSSFSVKVIEREISGFLWFGNKPAVVSFTYTFDQKESSKLPVEASGVSGIGRPERSVPVGQKSVSPNKSQFVEQKDTKSSVGSTVIKRRELKPKNQVKIIGDTGRPLSVQNDVVVVADDKGSFSGRRVIDAKGPRAVDAGRSRSISGGHGNSKSDNNNNKAFKQRPKVSLDSIAGASDLTIDVDFSSVYQFVQGFFEVVAQGSSVGVVCAIVGKDLNVSISGLDVAQNGVFTSSQVSWALSSLIALVLKKEFGKRFQKYRIMILFQ